MSAHQLKTGYFVLEGLNSFATVYYFYYLYFFMQKAFGFGNKANLALAALIGAISVIAAWWGGRFAQRCGYFTALKLGFVIMTGALAAGTLVGSASGQILAAAATVIGMCFTWPTLEALVSEDETRSGLQRSVGLYNVVWAATGALAYFTGGAMLDHLGFKSLFYVPGAIQLGQLGLTLWLEPRARRNIPGRTAQDAEAATQELTELAGLARSQTPGLNSYPVAKAKLFLRMAWLANPFAYVSLNTLIALTPGVAKRLGLSTMLAGFCCSVWCFARLGAFIALWFWGGWHYRFRWLLVAYVMLVAAFAAMLMVPNLAVLLLAQIAFGSALGLIYYSSLFYSMDLSKTKGEHGGIHEAAIGLGNFAGPAVGAASLQFLPQYANSSALAVSGLLILGLGGLLGIWRLGKAR